MQDPLCVVIGDTNHSTPVLLLPDHLACLYFAFVVNVMLRFSKSTKTVYDVPLVYRTVLTATAMQDMVPAPTKLMKLTCKKQSLERKGDSTCLNCT